jgi:hypothetical protein
VKVAFDENIPAAMVKVFETFASERALKKLSGNLEIESAAKYTPKPQESDYLPKNDVPWIKRFAQASGRVVISGNTKMRFIPHERLALIECGMITIFFESRWNNWSFFDKCAHLMHWWPLIAKRAKTAKKGSFYVVPLNWTASNKGKLRAISNRDPRELRLERRAKVRAKPPKKAKSPKSSAQALPMDDLFARLEGIQDDKG